MTLLNALNLYTLRRFDMIDAEKFNRLHAEQNLCADCPPVGYPTDKTRCTSCPHRESSDAR
jgi:hypothetical protein